MKQYAIWRVYAVADKLNFSKVGCDTIIKEYIEELRNDVLACRVVVVPKLFTIKPTTPSTDSIRTLGNYALSISQKYMYPYFSVLSILEAYIMEIVSDLKNNESINLYRLATVHAIYDLTDKKYKYMTELSKKLRTDFFEIYALSNNIRIHGNKMLKWEISELPIQSKEEVGV